MSVKVGDIEITSRVQRTNRLKQVVGKKLKVVDLEELKTADLGNVTTLVVLSRELDKFGSFAADLHPQGLFEMVDRIAENVRFAVEKGFQTLFVVADHGFLFAPEGCKPSTVPAISDRILAKRRFIVGGQAEGYWGVRADEMGLQGNLLFSFPEGFSIFGLPGEPENFFHGGLSLQESVIPMLCGRASVVPKIAVRIKFQQPISSRILKLVVEGESNNLFARPRKLKVRVGNKESEIVEVDMQHRRQELSLVWLDGFETPPEISIVQLLDAETGEVIEEKQAQVNLLF